MNWTLIFRSDTGAITQNNIQADSPGEALTRMILVRGRLNDDLIAMVNADHFKTQVVNDGKLIITDV